ncbi:Ig-like domain repeat protein [Cuneatibacter sp. NSJ-177]|uniref:PF13754 domain-containing protein n=1 Tax=Cuneatibacter sp. NSJ-177 TaxID=2931401 RepID=UPI001FD368EF|nr:PF13754 domain-containing protein [Cuneatibacter sp. NSJ-177]MCJ7834569.1 Ig-like domain repeat protein [Cuneatibacter sp. NSJ-177]
MAVARVFGKIDGTDVVLECEEGDRWNILVPLDTDGEYVVEIVAEDEAGNWSYIAKLLYTVDAGNLCIHMLPLPKYLFDLQPRMTVLDRIYPVCQEVSL